MRLSEVMAKQQYIYEASKPTYESVDKAIEEAIKFAKFAGPQCTEVQIFKLVATVTLRHEIAITKIDDEQ